MIIRAKITDIERIIPCAEEYTAIIPDMELNSNHYVDFWRDMVATKSGVIFLSEVDEKVEGGIGGIKYPEPLSGKLTAVEMFWFMSEQSRGEGLKLYYKFKQWAKAEGCKRLAMIYLPCSMPDKLQRFYEREGLSLREMHYEGDL